MSIAGIASNSNLFQNSVVQQTQNRFQQIQSQFQKLGQDLQSGNLTQAQSDFSTLSQELPNGGQFGASSATSATSATGSTAATSSSNPVLQAFQSLGKDLQSGNLSAAQQDFAAIQQSAQQAQSSGQAHHGHHHHHSGGDSSSSTSSPTSTLQQDFTSLGSDLQSGNLSSAQQAYASLQSDLQQFLPELRFLHWFDAKLHVVIRNHRRQRHRVIESAKSKTHRGHGASRALFFFMPSGPKTNRAIPKSASALATNAHLQPRTSQNPHIPRLFTFRRRENLESNLPL